MCRSKQTVQCYRTMYKCCEKNVRSSKQMHMSLHFNSQHIAQDSIMSAKRIIKITYMCVYDSASHSQKCSQCSIFNAQPFDKTNSLKCNTHTAHTQFHVSSYSRCPCIYHMNTNTHTLRLLIKSQITLEKWCNPITFTNH